jgi:hypothetical protein
MGKASDVKLTVGLDGVTPVGLSLNFSAGAVPTCTVDLAPSSPGIIKIINASSGVLSSPDSKKREEVDVDISVTIRDGNGGSEDRKLKWIGLLDGLSIGNTVGSNSYQAVLKGKAQTLLELTTVTPGLYPTSVNIYKNPFYSVMGTTQGATEAEIAWVNSLFSEGLDFQANPFEFYKKLLAQLLKLQDDGYEQLLGNELTVDSTNVLREVFKDQRYKKAIQQGKDLIDKVDLQFVTGGAVSQVKTSYPQASSKIREILTAGPNVLLENYMNFLRIMGCTFVCANEKIFIVPDKNFILQPHSTPGKKQGSSKPNIAYPADYNSYVYNDNGYRDFLAVVVGNTHPVGGQDLNTVSYETGLAAHYIDKKNTTKASGVLVVPDHPFSLAIISSLCDHGDSKELKPKLDAGSGSYYPQGEVYQSNEQQENQKSRAQEKKTNYDSFTKTVMSNYAETKFYQARYGDRQGTITMPFNPKWVPGASGNLFVRETNFFIDFFVESVTHRVDMTPPSGGNALTIVQFSCGRMGTVPIGVSKDEFLGADKGKEDGFIQGFLQDIGAT